MRQGPPRPSETLADTTHRLSATPANWPRRSRHGSQAGRKALGRLISPRRRRPAGPATSHADRARISAFEEPIAALPSPRATLEPRPRACGTRSDCSVRGAGTRQEASADRPRATKHTRRLLPTCLWSSSRGPKQSKRSRPRATIAPRRSTRLRELHDAVRNAIEEIEALDESSRPRAANGPRRSTHLDAMPPVTPGRSLPKLRELTRRPICHEQPADNAAHHRARHVDPRNRRPGTDQAQVLRAKADEDEVASAGANKAGRGDAKPADQLAEERVASAADLAQAARTSGAPVSRR